jgi:hypothetical protein
VHCNGSSERKDNQNGAICNFWEEVIQPHSKQVQYLVGQIDTRFGRLSSHISLLERSIHLQSGILTSSKVYDDARSNLITEAEEQTFSTLNGLAELDHESYLLEIQAVSKVIHYLHVPCNISLPETLSCISDVHASL